MITFIASPIGAGKSCYAACLAQKALRRKKYKYVYSNTEIANCYKITVKDLEKLTVEEQSLIIIDETGNEFNSRDFQKTSKALIEFFKLSRHYKADVIFISQTFTDSDKQIRELAQKILFIRPIIPGLLSMVVNVKGDIGIGLQGEICMKYRIAKIGALCLLPRWFKYYDSYAAPERRKVELIPYRTYRPATIRVRVARAVKNIFTKIKKIKVHKMYINCSQNINK